MDEYRNELYLEFAIKILEFLHRDESKNPGALDRLRTFYVKTDDETIQDFVFNFCDNYNVNYSLSYSIDNKMHTLTFKSQSWESMPEIKVSDASLTDALVQGSILVFDRLVLLGRIQYAA